MGASRTGVALSDPLGITCSPLSSIRERDADKLLLTIVSLAREHDACEIVVGLPRPLAGGTNEQLERTAALKESLAMLTGIPVSGWDERFTSKLAEGLSGRKGDPDSVAACYMLQSYLDHRIRD